LVKIEGKEWEKAEDWTEKEAKYFCRSLPEDRIEELVIVISNHEWQNRNAKLPKWWEDGPAPVVATNIGCPGWTGSFTATWHDTEDGDVTTVVKVENATFTPKSGSETSREDFTVPFDLTSTINVTWSIKGVRRGCKVDGGPTTISFKPITSGYPDPGQAIGILHVAPYDGDVNSFFYRMAGVGITAINTTGLMEYTVTCEGSDGTTIFTKFPAGAIGVTPSSDLVKVQPDGTITDHYTDGSTVIDYQLHPLPPK
jgi:hypothetical protein